jgi:proteasome lid subunit RPN8/RPN11
MDAYLLIYRRDGIALSKAWPLLPIVRTSLQYLLGRDLAGTLIELKVYPVPSEPQLAGDPVVINLSANYGYAQVRLTQNGHVIYQHPHTIEELVSKTLQKQLKNHFPTEILWGFYLVMTGIAPPPPKVLPLNRPQTHRPTPYVKGSVPVTPYGPDERPAFGFKRLPEAALPKASLADFNLIGGGGDHQAFVKVLVSQTVYEAFNKTKPFSNEVEEGGFLVGRVYEDHEVAGTYLLKLVAAVNAEYTGASLLHFTYTGDSFSAFNQTLREQYPNERLLGWYHTHLFPATTAMGLSSIDLALHFTTFRLAWQLAALINLEDANRRTLRFYVRQSDIMVPCPQWIIQ